MTFLILSVAAYVVVSYLVAQTLSNQVSALKRTLDSLSEDVTDLDDELLSAQKRLREAEIKLASHDEMIALAHDKFDRLNAERDLKDAATSP